MLAADRTESTAAVAAYHCLDHELISRTLAGNDRSYQQLVQRYHRLVKVLVQRYLRDLGQIEEAIQDTFMRAYRALGSFRGEAKFSSWLGRIAVTTAINYRRCRTPHTLYDPTSVSTVIVSKVWPVDRVDLADRKRMVHSAIDQLSERDSQLMRLFYIKEQSIAEICQRTGLTATNVKSRLCRARYRLRTIIQDRYAEQLLN